MLDLGANVYVNANNLLEFAAAQYEHPKYKLGEHEWPALKRMLKKNTHIFKLILFTKPTCFYF